MVPWTYVINDRNGEAIIGTFFEKEQQKNKPKKFRVEIVFKKKEQNICQMERIW